MAVTGKGARLNSWAFRTSQWGRQAPQLPRKRLQFGETDNTEAAVWADWFFAAGGAPPFPTQYAGLRIRKGAENLELCLVATADAPAGMGGQLRVRKGAATYAAYLVETNDANASALRIRTTTGTKAIRKKT